MRVVGTHTENAALQSPPTARGAECITSSDPPIGPPSVDQVHGPAEFVALMTRRRRQQQLVLPEFTAPGTWPPSWPGPTVDDDTFHWSIAGEYSGVDYRLDVTAVVADDDRASATASATWGGMSAATEGWTSADAAQRWAVGQVAGWVKDAGRR